MGQGNVCPVAVAVKPIVLGELTTQELLLYSHGFSIVPDDENESIEFEGWQHLVASDVMKLMGAIDKTLNVEACETIDQADDVILVPDAVLTAYKAMMYTAMADAARQGEKAAYYKKLGLFSFVSALGMFAAVNVPSDVWNSIHKAGVDFIRLFG